ncbi:hypothetical protein GCM10022254_45010 [Actinomadura meridiana]|uniref:FXSXX-COOH protein n=1 Tax=Actinomadura meridiana TaxID=559626 RepID=A0ABP8C9Y8_9ACTN
MPLTLETSDSELAGSARPLTHDRPTTEQLKRIEPVANAVLRPAARRALAEREGTEVTEAGFDNRL